MTGTIKINAGNGGSFSAYVANKKGVQGRAILLIQEIFGVNQTMRDLADDFSLLGYVVVCPDLFWRIQPEIRLENYDKADWDSAFGYFKAFDVERGVDDLKATLAHMRGMKEIAGNKIASIGYCLGGKLAYLMSTRTDIDASVSYYGVGLEALLDEAPRIARPLMIHMAGKDRFVPPAAQAKITAALSHHPNVALHVYEEQDHAFARVGGDHWDAAAAAIANESTVRFLRQALA